MTLSKLGRTPELSAKLRQNAVYDTRRLLVVCSTPALRQALAQSLGIESGQVLELANQAGLARVDGIGTVFSNLLEEAGVDTVRELATRNPANLHETLVKVNAVKHLTRRAPSSDMVRAWIAQAKRLVPSIEY
jgi:predicted flap endonuclease-1-like 5' DNA nuclease